MLGQEGQLALHLAQRLSKRSLRPHRCQVSPYIVLLYPLLLLTALMMALNLLVMVSGDVACSHSN